MKLKCSVKDLIFIIYVLYFATYGKFEKWYDDYKIISNVKDNQMVAILFSEYLCNADWIFDSTLIEINGRQGYFYSC